MMNNFVPLRNHSTFSLLTGVSQPKDIAKQVAAYDYVACGITEHGNISSCIEFYKDCLKQKIRPILGLELNLSIQDASVHEVDNKDTTSIILIAKNFNGWKTLLKINNIANIPKYNYQKPRLDFSILSELYDNNLFCITGYEHSTLDNKDEDELIGQIPLYKEVFGDNLFWGVDSIQSREKADKYQLRKVALPNSYYTHQNEVIKQRIVLASSLNNTFKKIYSNIEDNKFKEFFTSDKYHIRRPENIAYLFTAEEINNTKLISDSCEQFSILSPPQLPNFPTGDITSDEYLRELCRKGWRDKIVGKIDKSKYQEYGDRVKKELAVFIEANLASYFLIVQDYSNYFRNKGYLLGSGRGSAAGSLVAYLIGITTIDPIPYNLLFERFYNAGRNVPGKVEYPDIDMDFPTGIREDVITYISDKYGKDKVAQIATFQRMQGKGALKDVLRVYGEVSFDEVNKITAFIPDEAEISDQLELMKESGYKPSIIQWALENNVDELAEWCRIEDGKLVGELAPRFREAIDLEGTKKATSKHAAGVVISNSILMDNAPMMMDKSNKDNMLLALEMDDAKDAGLVKMDILGINLLDKLMFISKTIHGKKKC